MAKIEVEEEMVMEVSKKHPEIKHILEKIFPSLLDNKVKYSEDFIYAVKGAFIYKLHRINGLYVWISMSLVDMQLNGHYKTGQEALNSLKHKDIKSFKSNLEFAEWMVSELNKSIN